MTIWIAIGIIALLVVIAVMAGNLRKTKTNDPTWQAQQAAALAERKAAGWQELEGGLLWRRIAGDGSGKHPTVADTVKLNYEGKLVDGTVFDSSWKRGEPASFPLAGLIEAWKLALPKAGVGDTIEIAVPAALGYGDQGAGPIPGGATLLFKIELLGIE
ncbi:FKBP-type peptidyl-prolyl cis-trans isomerase [Sphingomonas sp.]|uniref:FKBP-type peptidyl-prolyl cis-trans isomerase n=1 Tax=Sphingomonas sp. TaxID=28214 RepID=UPI001B198CE5|nr:FKBP-type peptidyl-prolyl cis-trans isomerase [Sphingomonas sp.]MBO9711472.1 FKBP-type peptidyl-prolyl cis-trans isomerase [Sphingomonas sp.]